MAEKPDLHATLPWVEKYRPSDLSELISHRSIISTITTLISENKLPHLLFYGPPGTGKTSTILAIAKTLYGKHYQNMILELNASDDRGIDVVRNEIKNFANTRNLFSVGEKDASDIRNIKLVVLDEADAMTSAAQAALRRVIEKYTRTTRFCIICNYLNKITPAIQSRCTRFRFPPLSESDARFRLDAIIKSEDVSVTEDGRRAIIKLAQGDMRKCLNILQSCSMAYPEVSEESVYACTGQPLPKDIEACLGWLLNEDFTIAFRNIIKLQTTKGLALQDIITQIHTFVMKLKIPSKMMMFLLEKLADIEVRLSSGTSEKLNLGALVGAFQLVRQQVFAQSSSSVTPMETL